MHRRRFAWLGFGGLAATLGACQLVSGLSGYQESSSSATASSGTTGGATASSGTGGATASSGTGGATASSGSTTSGAGGCPAPTTVCENSAVCVNLMTSAQNCGACNQPCQDPLAACAEGKCTPGDLGGPYDAVTAISANGSGVAWAAATAHTNTVPGGVTIYARTGSGALPSTTFPYPDTVGGVALAKDGQSVFYTRSDPGSVGLWQWAPQGNGSTPLSSAQTGVLAAGAVVQIDTDHVAWGAQVTNGWHLHLMVVSTQALLSMPGPTPSSPPMVSDGAYVYWPFNTQFDQISAAGSTSLLGNNVPTPDHLACDSNSATSGFLYYFEGAVLNRMQKTALGTPDPYPMTAITQVGANGLVVKPFGSTLYWIDGSGSGACLPGGQIVKATWTSPPVAVPLATGLMCPDNLATDGTYLYYSSGTPGPSGSVHVKRVPM